jgi:DNA-binding protein Fis
MSSAGWIKKGNGYILFKNRDISRETGLWKRNVNTLYLGKEVIGFRDRNTEGLWIGVNKYGLGITSSQGSCKKIPNLREENSKVTKEVLRNCKKSGEAAEAYLDLMEMKGIEGCYNVIISDMESGILLEICKGRRSNCYADPTSDNVYVRTNHFATLGMKKYNDPEGLKNSEERLEKLRELTVNVEKPEDLKSILQFHSDVDGSSICRHGNDIMTVASAILGVNRDDKSINIYYVLNKFPCKTEYKHVKLPEWINV